MRAKTTSFKFAALCLLLAFALVGAEGAVLVNQPVTSNEFSVSSSEPSVDLSHPLFTKDQIGYMVWTVMHFYSAFAPETPNVQERAELATLITLL